MLVVNPTLTAVHFPVNWEVNGVMCELTQSTINASVDLDDGFISLTTKIVWGAERHSTRKEFNFCRELSITFSPELLKDFLPLIAGYFRGSRKFFMNGDDYFVFLPRKSWMIKVTRLATTIEVVETGQPDTTKIEKWLLDHLEAIVHST